MPLLVAMLALGAGGAGGMLALGPAVAPMLVSDPSQAPDDQGGGQRTDSHGEPISILHTVDDLLVNPASSGGTRFLLVSVALEVADPSELDALVARDVELRDALIRCFGTKTVPELADVHRRGALIEEVKATIDHTVGAGVVTKIYLPQYVIQ